MCGVRNALYPILTSFGAHCAIKDLVIGWVHAAVDQKLVPFLVFIFESVSWVVKCRPRPSLGVRHYFRHGSKLFRVEWVKWLILANNIVLRDIMNLTINWWSVASGIALALVRKETGRVSITRRECYGHSLSHFSQSFLAMPELIVFVQNATAILVCHFKVAPY